VWSAGGILVLGIALSVTFFAFFLTGMRVANRAREDGLTFLDVLWDGAPFRTHRDFMTAVNRTAGIWRQAGRLSEQERTAVVAAAAKAERELV